MPAYTYQVAIREDGHWLREYVCAESEVGAVYEFCEQHPEYPLEWILQSDDFEVEACV